MDAKALKEYFNQLKSVRNQWDVMYQIIGEYVAQNRQDFQACPQPGEFLVNDIYDSTAVFAAAAASGALLGMLWSGAAERDIEIQPPEDLELNTELSEFYERVTKRSCRALDDPKANLSLTLDEYMNDQVIFGTSGIGVERGTESKLLFRPFGVKESYLDEGKNGRVDTFFIYYEWEVKRVVSEFGLEKVSEKTRECFNNGKLNDKVKLLSFCGKRLEKTAERGKGAMAFHGLTIEYDNEHLIGEDGFHELPINFVRFRKLNYEKYGRSPAMNALPDIREANALREAVIIATEKALDMPKGVMNDSVLGGGVIDTSPNAINVFNMDGVSGTQLPIFDIGKPPEITVALARLESLTQSISQHFFIDRLLDFNNQTQMTYGEAQLREQIRSSSLSTLFSRQITEGLTPTFERAINMLWRDGEFGVVKGSEEEAQLILEGKEPEYIPDAIAERLANGQDVYQIVYKTRAANAAKAEDYAAVLDIMNITGQAANLDPSVLNRIDAHSAIKEIAKIRAVPNDVVRQDDAVEAIMQQQQQQQQMAQMLEGGQAVAGITKDLAQAQQAEATANERNNRNTV